MEIRSHVLFIVLILLCFSNCTIFKRSPNGKLGKRFSYHFNVLDSVVNANPAGEVYYNCPMQLTFMEEYTGIPSDGEGTSIGRIWFNKKNLQAWHAWYDNHFRKIR